MEYTDKELLELAALAAGYKLKMWCEETNTHESFFIGYMPVQGKPYPEMWSEESWNPLVDDGEAMRLAVDLRLTISRNDCQCCVDIYGDFGNPEIEVSERFMEFDEEAGDAYLATRRAIVRAAAELGMMVRDGNAQ